jgi:hypothetical protein
MGKLVAWRSFSPFPGMKRAAPPEEGDGRFVLDNNSQNRANAQMKGALLREAYSIYLYRQYLSFANG